MQNLLWLAQSLLWTVLEFAKIFVFLQICRKPSKNILLPYLDIMNLIQRVTLAKKGLNFIFLKYLECVVVLCPTLLHTKTVLRMNVIYVNVLHVKKDRNVLSGKISPFYFSVKSVFLFCIRYSKKLITRPVKSQN